MAKRLIHPNYVAGERVANLEIEEVFAARGLDDYKYSVRCPHCKSRFVVTRPTLNARLRNNTIVCFYCRLPRSVNNEMREEHIHGPRKRALRTIGEQCGGVEIIGLDFIGGEVFYKVSCLRCRHEHNLTLLSLSRRVRRNSTYCNRCKPVCGYGARTNVDDAVARLMSGSAKELKQRQQNDLARQFLNMKW